MNSLRIGVIGLGHVGMYHLEKYRKLGAKLCCVADVVAKRAEGAGSRYGCLSFSDYRDMIGLVDAVSIAVPTASHFAVARDLLDAGIDVLLEKPIAERIEDARELNEIALRKDCIFQIGFVERFNPAILALEKIIDTPLFVESHRLHPYLPRGIDVDVVLDLMIHDLDILIKFVKSPVRDVSAVGVRVISDRVDIANARLVFSNNCVANVTASRVTDKKMQKMRFFSPQGYHAVDFAERQLLSVCHRANSASQADIVRNEISLPQLDPLEAEIHAFLSAVTNRTPPPVSGEEAILSLELAVQILDKIQTMPGIPL